MSRPWKNFKKKTRGPPPAGGNTGPQAEKKTRKNSGGNPYPKILHDDGRFYGKYKHKPDAQISQEDLKAVLEDRKTSYGHRPRFVKPTRDKSYTSAVFHMGARKMEPTEVRKEDIIISEDQMIIKIPAFKHGERAGPLKLPLDRVGVDWILKQWTATRKKRPVWKMSPSTAYRVIVRALGYCPHWLRHNFITGAQQRLTGTPSDVDRKIMSWTGIKTAGTLDNYRMKLKEDIDEMGQVGLG